ncbi:MAG: hypothetical protein KR126chlam2_00674 [Chlamydiae bacterium]|nr:hypothetical protein [Chlamydiota bacterium]
MGIPPTKLPPSSSRSGGDDSSRVDKGKSKKEFKLPQKGEKGGEQKTLFDISSEEQQAQTSSVESAATQQAQTQQITQISALILRMVDQLGVGTVGGKEFASLDLKGSADVPEFFANSTITLTQSDEGLVVKFSNFESLQQQQDAIKAIEQNQQQLEQMMLNLQAKNINLVNLQIGSYSIALPTVQTVKPLEPPPITSETREKKGETEGEPEPIEGVGPE